MGVRCHLAVILILVASLLLIPACEEAEEDRVQEDILVWSGEITGECGYVLFDETAQELLLLADTSIWAMLLDDPGEGVELHKIVEHDSEYWITGLPYVTYEEGIRKISVPRSLRGTLKLREFTADDSMVYVGNAAGERYSEQVDRAQYFEPIMFVQQVYRFTDGARWFELTIAGEQGEDITYRLELYQLAEEPEGPRSDAPGYLVDHHDDGYSLWVAEVFADRYEDFSEWGREAVTQAREFFNLDSRTPVHLVVAPRDQKLHPRPIEIQGRYVEAYRRASIVHNGSQRLLRHEIMHAVHDEVLRRGGHTLRAMTTWVAEGLAEYFGHINTAQEEMMTLHVHQLARFAPLQDPEPLLQRRPALLWFGHVIMEYLVEEFGPELVVDYATALREDRTWGAEDRLAGEYFGMTQEQILRAALEDPPAIVDEYPAPDYVLTDWERLTDASGTNHGFTLSRDGERIALIAGGQGGIRILDLKTRGIEEVFNGHDLEGFVNLGTLSWFPCGERIAFMIRIAGAQDIYALNLKDGSHEEIIASEFADSGPDVSPCGEVIAFRSERTGHSEIYLKDLATGDVHQLTGEGTRLTWPVWSDDGSRLALVDNERHRLGIMDVNTTDIAWFHLEPHHVVSPSRPRWTNDDEIILTVAAHGLPAGLSLLSVSLSAGEQHLKGGLEVMTSWAEPIQIENHYYVRTSLWDPGAQAMHYGIARVMFERR